jgi:hypothetical protein
VVLEIYESDKFICWKDAVLAGDGGTPEDGVGLPGSSGA